MSEIVKHIVDELPLSEKCTNIIVKFQLNTSHIVVQTYASNLTVAQIRKDLSGKFQVPDQYLQLKQFGRMLADTVHLRETEKNDYGIVDLELGLSDDVAYLNSRAMKKSERIILDIEVFYRSVLKCGKVE